MPTSYQPYLPKPGHAAAHSMREWLGVCGGQLHSLVDALKQAMLNHSVLHADETPVTTLKLGNKKPHRAYRWAFY